jgi:DNA-binding Xre family transcriptional regulator
MARDDLSRFIQARLDDLHLSKNELARRTGLSRQALHKLLTGLVEECKISTFIKLACALESSPLILMRILLNGSGVIAENHAAAPAKYKLALTVASKYPDDSSSFIADITIPDNTLIAANSIFTKRWKILNNGSQVWERRRLICVDEVLCLRHLDSDNADFAAPQPTGLIALQKEIPIPRTLPGEPVLLSVELQTPAVPGTYVSYWKMLDEVGDLCFPQGQGLSCVVKVVMI